MNKNTRTALIEDILNATYNTADDYVQAAIDMVDAKSLGRTDRWKHACTVAGTGILSLAKVKRHLDVMDVRSHVGRGLEAMAEANK